MLLSQSTILTILTIILIILIIILLLLLLLLPLLLLIIIIILLLLTIIIIIIIIAASYLANTSTTARASVAAEAAATRKQAKYQELCIVLYSSIYIVEYNTIQYKILIHLKSSLSHPDLLKRLWCFPRVDQPTRSGELWLPVFPWARIINKQYVPLWQLMDPNFLVLTGRWFGFSLRCKIAVLDVLLIRCWFWSRNYISLGSRTKAKSNWYAKAHEHNNSILT